MTKHAESPRVVTTFRIDKDLLDGLRGVWERDGVPVLRIPAHRERSFRANVNTHFRPMVNTDSGHHERRFRP